MKRIVVAGFLGLALAQGAPAAAQETATPPAATTSALAKVPGYEACGPSPAAPQVPEKFGTTKALSAAVETLNKYIQESKPVFECRKAALAAARAEVTARQDSINAAVAGFNAELQSVEAMRAALGAQVEAANAKNGAKK